MGNSRKKHREASEILFFMFRWWGLWNSADHSNGLKKILYTIYGTMGPCSMWIHFFTVLADCLSNSDDLDIIIEDGCLLMGALFTIMKHLVFVLYRKKMIELIDEVYMPIDNLAKSSDEGVITLISSVTFRDKLQVYGFNMLGIFLSVGLIILSPSEAGTLPIRAQFPFNTTVEPLHSIAYGIQCHAILTCIVSVLCTDGLTMGFCRFMTVQLEVLSSNYRHCQTKWPLAILNSSTKPPRKSELEINSFIPFTEDENQIINDSFIKRFKICMKHHQRLIDITDHLNAIFGVSMLFQLFASTTMICFAGFEVIVSTKGIAYAIRFTLFASITITHLLAWCFMGNELLYQGMQTSASPWLSGWEDEDYKNYSYFINFALIRGKRTFEIKAINFFSISMPTFISILRASYSFFTLLAGAMGVTDDE